MALISKVIILILPFFKHILKKKYHYMWFLLTILVRYTVEYLIKKTHEKFQSHFFFTAYMLKF